MTTRMAIALASLLNALVALYLHLWKLGLAGSLACTGSGGCEYVQGSQYGWFLGIDVALIGTIGYALLFVTAVIGTLPRFADGRALNTALQLLVWPAVAFTVRLKWAEWIVLRSFCPWCAISAITITSFAVLVVLDRRRVARLAA
ncbi:MAG: vitamin K epoxide reductase family protein [Gemmatimonadaceae bacterium]